MSEKITRRRFCAGVAASVLTSTLPGEAASTGFTGLKPLIKYRGGKSKEFPQYERFIPKEFDTYYEPFVGGGATFFRLMPATAVIGDINEPLINFYRGVRDNFEKLSKQEYF